MGCYVRGDKNGMGCYVRGDKNSVGCFVRGVKKWHGKFCPGMFCPAPDGKALCSGSVGRAFDWGYKGC